MCFNLDEDHDNGFISLCSGCNFVIVEFIGMSFQSIFVSTSSALKLVSGCEMHLNNVMLCFPPHLISTSQFKVVIVMEPIASAKEVLRPTC